MLGDGSVCQGIRIDSISLATLLSVKSYDISIACSSNMLYMKSLLHKWRLNMISFIANLILCVLFAIFFMYLFGWWLIPALAIWGLIVLAEGGKR